MEQKTKVRLKNCLIVGMTVILLFFVTFFRATRITGHSMERGIQDGDYVIMGMIPILMHDIRRGDIVVFADPENPRKMLLKRVIGLPGEKLVLKEGLVFVNGKVLYEPYLKARDSWTNMSLAVPKEHYFMLGDNRPQSGDSRSFGSIHEDEILMKYICSYWPLFRNDSPRSVFAGN